MPRHKKESKRMARRTRRAFKNPLQAPKGFSDILPPQIENFETIRQISREIANLYNYQFVEVPFLEYQNLFASTSGIAADARQKGLFSFKTKEKDEIALRPELTTGLVRAYIQNKMFDWPPPVKLWSWGPIFRYANLQKEKGYQSWQVDFEYFGAVDPVVDAEVIQTGLMLLQTFGFKDGYIEINTLGCSSCRESYKKVLKAYYRSCKRKLCDECKARYEKNVLCLLTCEDELCKLYRQEGPQIFDFLCKDCSVHFKQVLGYLEDLKVSYELNPYLVRGGLDYYNRTVFKFFVPSEVSDDKEKSLKLAFGEGGRYDYLVSFLAGPDTPVCGFSLELERLAKLLQDRKKAQADQQVDLYLMQIGDLARTKLLQLIPEFFRSRIVIGFDLSLDSLKAQLKSADRLKARYVVIIGDKEVFDNTFIFRDMASGIQESFPMGKLMEIVKKKL